MNLYKAVDVILFEKGHAVIRIIDVNEDQAHEVVITALDWFSHPYRYHGPVGADLGIDALRSRRDCPEPEPEPWVEDESVRSIQRDARAECIRNAVDRLKPRDQRLIRRRHWQDATYTEIADAEEMSVGNVGVALLRAERRLAVWIQRLCAGFVERLWPEGRVP